MLVDLGHSRDLHRCLFETHTAKQLGGWMDQLLVPALGIRFRRVPCWHRWSRTIECEGWIQAHVRYCLETSEFEFDVQLVLAASYLEK